MECSNGSDICSFGYVLSDENFAVIRQDDVLINPESKFILTNRAGTQGISLAYEKEKFYAAPKFPERYELIKSLVENPENIAIGFAISNDAGFLRKACQRYNLPQLNFKFFDTQRLDAALHGDGNIRSLQKVIDHYGIEQDAENILHKSDDDAYFTLEILEKMLSESGLTFAQAAENYPQCCGESKEGVITYDGHSVSNVDKMRKKDIIVFRMTCSALREKYRNVKGVLSGKKIAFERSFENKNYRKMLVLAEVIYSLGGRLCSPRDCNTFVFVTEGSALHERMKQIAVPTVSYENFLETLSLTKERLDCLCEEIDIDSFKKRADELTVFN